ncbi:MAG: hypothetical protein VB071_02925 [Lawsonibacter sp.]|nr:hypothetical protein [Lawsonibacter sp.]
MVFRLKSGAPNEKIEQFRAEFENKGFSTIWAPGALYNAVCLIGNTAAVDMDHVVVTHDVVAYARLVTEQYKAVSRSVHPDDTVICVGGVQIGAQSLNLNQFATPMQDLRRRVPLEEKTM